jgi:hypothetical protein
MRLFLLALISLTPLCVKAQFDRGFERGYYILVDEPNVRHTGNMRIEPFYSTLIVKGEGKTLKLKPEQLLVIGNEKGKYLTVKDFHSGRVHIDADFAQQIDSGQVVVLFHSRGITGNGVGGSASTFFVRRATETTPFTALEAIGNKYREQVLPFLTSRPDLVKLIQEKQTNFYDLQALLLAFNTGQPYQPKR